MSEAKRLLEAVRAAGPAHREALLAALDPNLREELESLLASEDEENSLSETPGIGSVELRPLGSTNVSDRIGPYRLLREIGEGGMGVVYEAEQERPVRRKVALKLIKWGMDTKAVVARFESERQALALMNHPNIASVYDAGATAEGRPYFAMEYVHGIPITSYCDKHRLTIKERLELFMSVCDGIQHAHQKGIIHRDIKPSNVLVAVQDDKPVPKIIDFGVAKATSQRLTEHTVATELGQLIGTPEYMSPEQAEMTNLDIDTRTDVYSLGVLLYELLVGAQPFDPRELREAGLLEIQRRLREDVPPRPSTRVGGLGAASSTSAANRGVDVRSLGRQLRGDLDWIAMKALEKDRTRRYETANAMSLDVKRFLNSEAVQARAPSTFYRVRKFVERHKVGVATGAVVVVALVAGSVVATLGMLRAVEAEKRAASQANTSEEIADFLVGLFAVANPSEARGRDVTPREILDAGYEDVRLTLKEQPEVQARLLATIGKVYTSLGVYHEAIQALEQAASLSRTTLGDEHEETLAVLNDLAAAFFYQGLYEDAASVYQDLATGRTTLLGTDAPLTLRAKFDLASALYRLGRGEEALSMTAEVLDAQRRVLGLNHEHTLSTAHNLAVMNDLEGHHEEAELIIADVVERRRTTLGADHPDTLNSMNSYAAALYKLGRHEDAEVVGRDAVNSMRVVLGEGHLVTLNAERTLARIHMSQGRFEEAETRLLDTYRGLVASVGAGHWRTLEAAKVCVELYEAWRKPEKAAEYRALLRDAETASIQ